VPIKHQFKSGRGDNGDPGAVQPSGWNEDHVLVGMLAQLDALAAAPNTVVTFDGTAKLQLLPYSSFALSANAVLTGIPQAPTAAPGTNNFQIATTGFVAAAIAHLVASAPTSLDTLQELATALGNDANFSATVTAALGVRLRFDATQGLTSGQQAQGRANLGLVTVASSGAYADLTGTPSLGTAAAKNVGTAAGNVVQLDATTGKLPAIDGSQLTNLPGTVGGQLPATATNDNAAAGKLGECLSNAGTVSSMSSGTAFDFCSVTLTPGDWDVSAMVELVGNPWTVQQVIASISATSATVDSSIGKQNALVGPFTQYYSLGLPIVPYRFTVAAGTTLPLHLVGNVTWSSGSGSMAGRIQARRVR
jgi:hypothetical protein